MKVTKDLLEALLVKGWEIKYKSPTYKRKGFFEYRSPSGVSGDTYQIENLDEFPEVVEAWILGSLPLNVR